MGCPRKFESYSRKKHSKESLIDFDTNRISYTAAVLTGEVALLGF